MAVFGKPALSLTPRAFYAVLNNAMTVERMMKVRGPSAEELAEREHDSQLGI